MKTGGIWRSGRIKDCQQVYYSLRWARPRGTPAPATCRLRASCGKSSRIFWQIRKRRQHFKCARDLKLSSTFFSPYFFNISKVIKSSYVKRQEVHKSTCSVVLWATNRVLWSWSKNWRVARVRAGAGGGAAGRGARGDYRWQDKPRITYNKFGMNL